MNTTNTISPLMVLVLVSPFASVNAQRITPVTAEITDVSAHGSGCPPGSVASAISLDKDAVTIIFDQLIAELAAGSPDAPINSNSEDPARINQRGCNIFLRMAFPPGWSYTIQTVDTRGYAALDAGVRGVQRNSYMFPGLNQKRQIESTLLVGPFADDYKRHDSFSQGLWSPCNRNKRTLKINTVVRVTRDQHGINTGGLLTVDSIDSHVTQAYSIQWRQCAEETDPPRRPH